MVKAVVEKPVRVGWLPEQRLMEAQLQPRTYRMSQVYRSCTGQNARANLRDAALGDS
jgi:hypothetical protein